ncbi:hypothetical protein PR003_g5597 [Phytophthora rubi]|uniref:Uncharacterized protein n=1 Tax=Phytophthora rubi TaxID=129364 RepID=A0A6A3NGA9_9STRA|nr:hypothetical protein PR001_g5320 [Phytophthora rubi]KAE9349969.1 hypothetical protein PR003_g5597 [Phytophthora rubi]
MEELFGRVLSHVPTPQLHESYNAVVHEDFASVSQTLDDVVAAFAKLQEVRDAVSKLQQSHESSTDRRTDSVRTLADNSMVLQQQLQCQVKKLAAGMEVAQVERNPVGTDPPVRSSGGDVNENEERGVASSVKGASGSEASSSSESESDDDDGSDENSDEAEVASKVSAAEELSTSSEAKSEPSPANDAKRLETDTQSTAKSFKKSATHMKVIIEMVNTFSPLNRSFIIPEVLAALKRSVEEDVGGMQQSEATASLKVVLSWGDRRKGYQVQHVKSYREYAAVVESYAKRLPSSARSSELERLKDALCCMIKILEGCLTSGSEKADILTAVQDARKKYLFSQRMAVADTMPSEKRIETLLRMLIAFKKETTANVSCAFGGRMIKVIIKASRWLSEDVHDPVQSLVHRIIVDAFREFSSHIPTVLTRDRVVRLLDNMSEGISDPSNPRTRAQLTGLRNRATQAFKELKQYQRKPMSPREAHELTEAVRNLVEDVTVGWAPHRDVLVRKCVQELKNVLVQAQTSVDIKKSRSSFQVCLSKIVKWKVENPSVALEEERKRKRVDEEASMVPIVVTPARSKDGAEVMNNGAAKKAKRLEDGIGPDSDSSGRDMKTASVVTQEVAAASSSDSSSSSETESDDSEDESDENGEEGSEAAWKALTTTGAGNSVKQSTGKLETQGEAEGTMTPDIVVDNSVIYMKTIVEDVNSMSPTERSFIIPDVLAALKKSVEEDIDGMHPNEVASSLNILVGWWAGQCEDQIKHVKLYRELAAVVKMYVVRLPMSTQKSGLNRLLDCLNSAIKNLRAIPERDTKRTTIRSDKKWGLFSDMVGMRNAQRHFRGKHRLHVLVALRQETAAGINDAFGECMLEPIAFASDFRSINESSCCKNIRDNASRTCRPIQS